MTKRQGLQSESPYLVLFRIIEKSVHTETKAAESQHSQDYVWTRSKLSLGLNQNDIKSNSGGRRTQFSSLSEGADTEIQIY